MQKSDLKTGDIVVYRDGQMRQVLLNTNMGDLLIGDAHNELSNYTDDLYDRTDNPEFDIVKVKRPQYNYQFMEQYWFEAPTIEKQSSPKKMTVEQICKALGYEVEVVR